MGRQKLGPRRVYVPSPTWALGDATVCNYLCYDVSAILINSKCPIFFSLLRKIGARSSFMSGVYKRVKRMARSTLESGTLPSQRRASTGYDGTATNSAQASVAAFLGSQRGVSFSSMRPLPPPGGSNGPLSGGGSSAGGGGGDLGCSSHDAPISSGISYSDLRPYAGGEASTPLTRASVGAIDLAPATSAPLGTRPPSFSSGRGMASELVAGLRQASQGSLGRGAAGRGAAAPPQPSSPLPHLPTTKEGSVFALSMFNSYQSMQISAQPSNTGSAPPPQPQPQNMDVALSRLSGEMSTLALPMSWPYTLTLYCQYCPT